MFSFIVSLISVRLYQNKLGDKGVSDMVPGLLQAQSLENLRYNH